MALRLALAAAGRARTAAIAMGRQRCSLPRQPLGAQHQALLGMGARAVTPQSLAPPFSKNAVEGEGEGAAIASGGKDAAIAAGGKGASIDAAAQKTKAQAFDTLGSGNNADAEDATIAAAGKGASMAADKGDRSNTADADAAAQKTKAQAFDLLGSGNNAEAEDADIGLVEVGAGGNTADAAEEAGPGVIKEEEGGKGDGDIVKEGKGGESAGDIVKEDKDDAKEDKGGERVGALSSKTAPCFYDDPGLKAFMEKFIAEKTVDSALYVPGLTETLEHHRIMHGKERLRSDGWHFVLALVAVVLELMVVAMFELYMQTGTWEKEGNKEVLDDEKKKVLP